MSWKPVFGAQKKLYEYPQHLGLSWIQNGIQKKLFLENK